MSGSRSQRGFTLIEMVVAMSILAILVSLAVPSFRGMMIRNRAVSTANALLQLIITARSEAVKLQTNVTLCKTADGESCTTAGGWDQGILTFVDPDGDGKYTKGDASNRILRSDHPFTKGSSITGNSGLANSLTYDPAGRADAKGTFSVIPNGAIATEGRKVVMDFSRPQIREITEE